MPAHETPILLRSACAAIFDSYHIFENLYDKVEPMSPSTVVSLDERMLSFMFVVLRFSGYLFRTIAFDRVKSHTRKNK